MMDPGQLGVSVELIEPLELLTEPGTPVKDYTSSKPGPVIGPTGPRPITSEPQSWQQAAEDVIEAFSEQAVEQQEQHAHQHHHRKVHISRTKRAHEPDSSECSAAESVTERSHSCSSCYDSSGGSHSSSGSALGTSLSCSAASSCHGSEGCGARPKSFTVGQLQAHKHRLAASSTAARSSSPPLTGSSGSSSYGARCVHQHNGSCTGRGCNKCGVQQQRPTVSTAGGQRREAGGSAQTGAAGKPLVMSFSAGGSYCAGDVRIRSNSPGGLPQRGLLLAESVSVEEVGKGFRSRWYCSNRVLQVYDGCMPVEPRLLLKHVPQQPGLYLWLVKPPCSRIWVPVRLAAADDLRQALSECLHADGSCGPLGSKQRVLLDLQCRGFAVQVRYRPLKPSCGDVQQDLLNKLQRHDFALNDTDNNGCRPIELPDGRPVCSYPLVVGHMMCLFENLFGQPRLV